MKKNSFIQCPANFSRTSSQSAVQQTPHHIRIAPVTDCSYSMQRWEQLRSNPAVTALYTDSASDAQCLPYDVRDALGNLLLDTDFSQIVKPSEQKAFNETVVAAVNRHPLAQELWARWMKLPVGQDSAGKAKKHTHKTLFETLQQTADRELELISQLVEDTTVPPNNIPLGSLSEAVAEMPVQPSPPAAAAAKPSEQHQPVEAAVKAFSPVVAAALFDPPTSALKKRHVAFEELPSSDARVRAILAAARSSPPREREVVHTAPPNATSAAALRLIEQFSKH